MSSFSNVKITPIKGTPSGALTAGPIDNPSGDEEYITRWMPGSAALHIAGSYTVTSGDVVSGDLKYRPLIIIDEWEDSQPFWTEGTRYYASPYRKTAGTSSFDFTIPNSRLAPGTKYRVTLTLVRHESAVINPANINTWSKLPSALILRSSLWSNRTPSAPEIISPPTGVSIPYEDGVNSVLNIEWDRSDPDDVSTDRLTRDYYGWEMQRRTVPSPSNPAPAWESFTAWCYFSGLLPPTPHPSWVLDDGTTWGDRFLTTNTTGNNDTSLRMSASEDPPSGIETQRFFALMGPGTWQFRVRTFDLGGTGIVNPSSVPTFSTSEWSNAITINVTAPFLPPLPVSPINDVAVTTDQIRFDWQFRDPRAGGGTQKSARLRIRKAGEGDDAWTEIIPSGGELYSFPTTGEPTDIAVTNDGATAYVLDISTNRVRCYDLATRTETHSWAVGGYPRGITVAPTTGYPVTTDVYVTDSTNNLVRRFTPAGVPVTTWSTVGSPRDIEMDDEGSLWVADWSNGVVREFSPSGSVQYRTVTTPSPYALALRISSGSGYVDTASLVANMVREYNPYTNTLTNTWPMPGQVVALARMFGRLYVADSTNDMIHRFNVSTEEIEYSWATTGHLGGMTDADGLLYVTDADNDMVRVYDASRFANGANQFTIWTNGDDYTVEPGFRYEWQPRTVATPGDFDSGWSAPIATFWAIPTPGSGGVIPVPDITLPDPGLGCGDNQAFLFSRGGVARLGEITEKTMIKWGRTRDGISTCSITVSGWSRDCGELLKMMRSWMHEIVVYRDNGSGPVRVWEGPITRLTYTRDEVQIEAQDVWAYVYRRILRQGFNDSYRPNGGLTTVTRRSATILQNALAYDDPNLLAYLTVIERPDDARQSRVVADFSTTAWQQIDDFAAKSGLDYTAAGRKMILWDTHNAIGTLPEMRDGDFDTSPIVTEYGMQLANFYGVTNNSGVYGTAERLNASDQPEYYGWIEMLSSAYGESDEGGEIVTLTAAARQKLIEALTDQAERNIASRWPTPLVVRVPDNSTINPEVNIGINHLIPGVFIPLRATGTLREVTQMQKLDSMTVTQTAAGEQIQVTLSPAPRSRDEDPDEEGGEE